MRECNSWSSYRTFATNQSWLLRNSLRLKGIEWLTFCIFHKFFCHEDSVQFVNNHWRNSECLKYVNAQFGGLVFLKKKVIKSTFRVKVKRSKLPLVANAVFEIIFKNYLETDEKSFW